MKITIFITLLFIFCALNVSAQTDNQTICISPAAAEKCASNTRELAAQKLKVQTLEDALKLKDASIAELRETARKNEADLKAALNSTQIELALKTGQIISKDAEIVRLTAIVEFLLKNGRTKKIGLIVF